MPHAIEAMQSRRDLSKRLDLSSAGACMHAGRLSVGINPYSHTHMLVIAAAETTEAPPTRGSLRVNDV